jgi:hypothetical protein
MQDKQDTQGKSAELDGGSFTYDDDNGSRRATERQNAGGGSVAGVPAQRSVRNGTYQTQRHNFSDRAESHENVPSAGWRAVYASMGVYER